MCDVMWPYRCTQRNTYHRPKAVSRSSKAVSRSCAAHAHGACVCVHAQTRRRTRANVHSCRLGSTCLPSEFFRPAPPVEPLVPPPLPLLLALPPQSQNVILRARWKVALNTTGLFLSLGRSVARSLALFLSRPRHLSLSLSPSPSLSLSLALAISLSPPSDSLAFSTEN